MSLKRLTYQQRLIIGIAVLLFFTTLVLGFVGNELAEKFLLQRFRERMDFLAKYLAANAELGILLSEKQMLEQMAANLLSERDVVEVRIFNEKGKLLAKAGEAKSLLDVERAVSEVVLSTTSENVAFGLNTAGNRTIGKVEIYYVTSSIKELTRKLKKHYAFLTAVIAGVSMVIFLIFTKSITAPLAKLIELAQEVAAGNLDVKLEAGSLPETEKLARSINTMLEALKQSKRDLEETYQKLIQEKALAEIGHFAVTVAHEVKNPLGIIKGALDVLKKEEIDNEIRKTMIGYVEDEVQRLNALIKDFLDFSRPKPLTFQQVNLHDLIEEIVSRMEIEWAPKGIAINYVKKDGNLSIRADREALSRAIINIVKNACEVSSEGQVVNVSVTESNGMIVIEVADQGPGIPPEKQDKIFQPFFTEKSKGTGLGLTLAKKIIEAHMGYIEIEDNRPTGTKMKIILEE